MIAQKKKVMMMAAGPAPEPIPYITDGLIFWLDGLTVASDGLWVDRVSGAQYTLHNAVKTANGVTFAGDSTSYGESTATFPAGVTIEAAFSLTDTSVNAGIFGQNWPNVGDNAQPVLILCRTAQSQSIFVKYGTTSRQIRKAALSSVEIISAVRWINDSRAVKNGETVATTATNYLTYPADGISGSYIGTPSGTTGWLHGTLHSLRIYDRALTVAEMQANQTIDSTRYNLGVIS
jgi:hypothetical protein